MRAGRAVVFGLALASAGCAIHPTHVLDRMDAVTDGEVQSAVEDARGLLADRDQNVEVRKAAAKVLGRLRSPSAEGVEVLGRVLLDEGEPEALRAMSAWALGELRCEASLAALVAALKTRIDAISGHHVLEAIAKHDALVGRDAERSVEIVEALVFFAGNQPGAPPAIYDVVSDRSRTIPVSVRVLERVLDAAEPGKPAKAARDERLVAAMYSATYELFARLDASRSEILGGREAGAVEAAIRGVHRAFLVEEPRTQALALHYLGRLADLAEIASPAAEAFVGGEGQRAKRPTLARRPALRLIAAWSLARMELHAPGPRRALSADVLPRESERAVLGLLADLSSRAGELDQLQLILGVDAHGAGARESPRERGGSHEPEESPEAAPLEARRPEEGR